MLASAVTIETRSQVEIDRLGDSVWNRGWGSGYLVSRDPCEVWTNYHVVKSAAFITVHPYRPSSEGYAAQLFNADPRSDLAILRLETCEGIEPAVFGDSDTLRQGDTVFAVGNPSGRNPGSISRGIVSHPYRLPTGVLHFVQVDAAVCKGSSGGGLFNEKGELVAMTSAMLVDNEGLPEGFAYATPINLLRRAMERMRTSPPVSTHIGLNNKVARVGTGEAQALGVPGHQPAVAVVVSPDGPPSAGKIELRDIIYAIDGQPVTDLATFYWLQSRKEAGESLEISLVRSGERRTVRLPVVSEPVTMRRPVAEPYEGALGLQLEEWSQASDERSFFKSPVITRIANLGPAHAAGIRSSQHYLLRSDRVLAMTLLVEVEMVTGVFVEGVYRPVGSLGQLNDIAEEAAREGRALVLDVEDWLRNSPDTLEAPFVHRDTSYHRVEPRPFRDSPGPPE